MLVQRVEKHILKSNKELDTLCGNAKNLYNYCNYILRQSWFLEQRKLPNEFNLSKQLTREKQADWIKLGANANQQVLKFLYKNWKSYFAAHKRWKSEPEKFLGEPRIPNYKDKNGKCVVNFTCNNKSNIRGGVFYFPKFTNLPPVKTFVTNQNLCCARIVPQTNYYILEIIYKIEVPEIVKSDSYLSIDLGINNFATCLDNHDNSSFIIKGEVLKSYNQYFNKKKAELQSILKKVNNLETSKRLQRLRQKRKNKVSDFMHKASSHIIKYCLENGIWNIVVGHNDLWKQDINLGKKNNQKFTNIPFNNFINMLKYKCENYGINFIVTEESYTSKTDHLALESMEHHDKHLGKRKYRGLFVSSTGKILHADVNGALGILRKVIDDNSFESVINRGFITNPNKISIY